MVSGFWISHTALNWKLLNFVTSVSEYMCNALCHSDPHSNNYYWCWRNWIIFYGENQGCQVCVTKPTQRPIKTSPKLAQWPIKPAQSPLPEFSINPQNFCHIWQYILPLKSNSVAIIFKCIAIFTKEESSNRNSSETKSATMPGNFGKNFFH